MAEKFKPHEHFRNLKGQQYLEVKYRLMWFREEHPDGIIATELIARDASVGNGLFLFKARVSFMLGEREVYSIGHGSETVKDFADAAEKAETKAIGRALALLGYGTQFAQELEESDNEVVDSPVERRPSSRAQGGSGTTLAVVREGVDLETLRADVDRALSVDPEAEAKLPKGAAEMDEAELVKTYDWLKRRARAFSS